MFAWQKNGFPQNRKTSTKYYNGLCNCLHCCDFTCTAYPRALPLRWLWSFSEPTLSHSSYPTVCLSLKDMAMQCHHSNNNTWIMKINISIELAINRIPAAACVDRKLRTPRQQDMSLQCTTCTLMPCHQLRTDPTPSSQRKANGNTPAQVCHLSQTWRSCYFSYWLAQKLLQAIR